MATSNCFNVNKVSFRPFALFWRPRHPNSDWPVLSRYHSVVKEYPPSKEYPPPTFGVMEEAKDVWNREWNLEEKSHKHATLSRWLHKGHNCTWRRLVDVLTQMGETVVVADAIRLKYLTLNNPWLAEKGQTACFEHRYEYITWLSTQLYVGKLTPHPQQVLSAVTTLRESVLELLVQRQ